MGRTKQYSTISEDGRLYVREYSNNIPLQQAQKRYYEKNKDERLEENREYYKRWLEAQNMDEFKARQRASQKKYHDKKRELKKQQKESDEDKIAAYMNVFNEIFTPNQSSE